MIALVNNWHPDRLFIFCSKPEFSVPLVMASCPGLSFKRDGGGMKIWAGFPAKGPDHIEVFELTMNSSV